MPIPTPKAKRTGRNLQHESGTIYEVICPICDMTQWHRARISTCIFCGARMSVMPFDVIHPVITPEPNEVESSTTTEPDVDKER